MSGGEFASFFFKVFVGWLVVFTLVGFVFQALGLPFYMAYVAGAVGAAVIAMMIASME